MKTTKRAEDIAEMEAEAKRGVECIAEGIRLWKKAPPAIQKQALEIIDAMPPARNPLVSVALLVGAAVLGYANLDMITIGRVVKDENTAESD